MTAKLAGAALIVAGAVWCCAARRRRQRQRLTLAQTLAQALSAMNEHWQRMYHMTVYGPVGLDLAISKAAVAHKHYPAAYAGDADILLVPNYEVGNAIGKAMSVFAHARNAGVVVGARAPIALVSRSDSVESRLNSIALCCLLAEQEPTQPEQNV